MKLIYTGDFEKLKDFGFEVDYREWFQFKDTGTNAYVYIMPVSKEIKWSYCITQITDVSTIIYDLIKAGLVKKEEE